MATSSAGKAGSSAVREIADLVPVQFDDHLGASVDVFVGGLVELLDDIDLVAGWSLKRDLGRWPERPRSFHVATRIVFTSLEQHLASARHTEFLEQTARPLGATIASVRLGGCPASVSVQKRDPS
jgi:hypothetical protein